MKSFKVNPYSIYIPLAILTSGFISLAFFLKYMLNYDFFNSDVLWYWQDSLDLRVPFNPYHVPGYPFLIALVRAITFEKLAPLAVMMGINLAAVLVGAVAVYQSIKITGISERFAFIGACLFGLWPCVGLVDAVNPVSDATAIAFLLTGILALQNLRKFLAALLFGIAILIHKAMWPFVSFLFIAYIFEYRPRSWKDLVALLILVFPIFTLWLAGTSYHGTPSWIVTSNTGVGAESRATIPIMDGLLDTLRQTGLKGLVKSAIIVSLFLASILLIFINHRVKPSNFRFAIALSAASVALFLFLTHFEIWAAVRFSRILVLPLIWLVGYHYRDKFPTWLNSPLIVFILLILLSTQFAFSWYMAMVFFKDL